MKTSNELKLLFYFAQIQTIFMDCSFFLIVQKMLSVIILKIYFSYSFLLFFQTLSCLKHVVRTNGVANLRKNYICHQTGVKAMKNTFINPIIIWGQYYKSEIHSLSHCQHVLITYPVSFLPLYPFPPSPPHPLKENASYYAKATL